MSGLAVIAPLLGLIAGLAASELVQFAVQRYWRTAPAKTLASLTAFIVFPVATVLLFQWLPASTTHSALGVSPQVANKYLLTFDIPPAAANVDYRHSFFSALTDAADFDIAEEAFLKWMVGNNRNPVEFSTVRDQVVWSDGKRHLLDPVIVTPVSSMRNHRQGGLKIDNGYYFDDYDTRGQADNGLTIVYDSNSRRAYAWRTTY